MRTKPTTHRVLVAGDVSTRTAYRWLRRQPRLCYDTYLTVEWAEEELPNATRQALHEFDMSCKTLDDETAGRWEVRTRCWLTSQRRSDRVGWTHGQRVPDRKIGYLYARLISALLRTAHRDGIYLWVYGTLRGKLST